ncbi:MAG: aminotransferase class I/II-fold pyridoxal phosphate-dependent enzyme [Leptospirales bacterium]
MSEFKKSIGTQDFNQSKLSKKVTQLVPSGIRQFFDIVSQRDDVISLGVGEPDFVTPKVIIEEAISSLRKGYTHYTSNQGTASLRKAIATYLEDQYDLSYNPDNEILITVGVSEGIDLALRSVINPGDGVLFGVPSYVSYFPLVEMSGGKTQKVNTGVKDDFRMTTENIENNCDSSSKVMFINYPSNPTGRSYQRNELEKIAKLVEEKDLLVVSDEIYGGLTYDYDHTPFAKIDNMKERTVMLGGFSKTFAMTGWRVGFAVGPKEWIQSMLKIHQYSMLCAPTISQFAAEAALKYALPDAAKMKDEYFQRREFIVKEFNRIGLTVSKPEGAFFVFPNIKDVGLSSIDFATGLLDTEAVAVIPGTAFGDEGEGFIRCAYAASLKNLKTSVEKIERFINSV